MSRDRAHEILTLWKLCIEWFPADVINMALYVTGDIESQQYKGDPADALQMFPNWPHRPT